MFRMAIVPDQRHFPRLSTPNHRISTGGFRLRPKVHQAEVQAAVNAFCETCEAEPVDGETFGRTHKQVEKLAFYLNADQCQRVNHAYKAEMRRRLEAGGITLDQPPLRPHPDMDNTYFH